MTKQEALEAYKPENILKTNSAALKAVMRRFATEYNDPFIAAMGEAGRIVVGIAVPFAFEYLIQNSVLPMGRLTLIVGKTHSNKSALLYEFYRWLQPYGGWGYLLENESKASPEFVNSLIGYEDEGPVTPVGFVPTHSVENWQDMLQVVANDLRSRWVTKSDDNPYPPGRVFPAVIGLDSIMGKLSEESQSKIEADGHASRSFAHEALIITSYLKKYPQDIAEWPIHFVAVNHEKDKPKEPGQHVASKSRPGGVHIDFQQTFGIRLTKIKSITKVDTSTNGGFKIGGNLIHMDCYKNGLGEDKHRIQVPIIWFNRMTPSGGNRQYTLWDWDSAAVDVLTGFKEAGFQNKIKEICNLQKVPGDRYWCRQLDVAKADALPKTDIGHKISSNRQMRNDLRNLFGIKRQKVFQPGVDYLQQIEVLKAEIEDQME